MKLTVVLIIAGFLHAHANKGWAQDNVSLSFKNAPIQTVLGEIKKQTGYSYAFERKVIRNAKPVTIAVINLPLRKVLNLCFETQPFTYEIQDKTIIVRERTKPIEKKSSNILEAPFEVRGRVTNEKNEPVIGASVIEKGTKNATSTDENGAFLLKGIQPTGTLVISNIGYEPAELKIAGRTEINVQLRIAVGELEAVVINSLLADVPSRPGVVF